MELAWRTLVALFLFPVIGVGCASTDNPEARSAERICSTENTDWALGLPADEANGRKLFRDSGAGLANHHS